MSYLFIQQQIEKGDKIKTRKKLRKKKKNEKLINLFSEIGSFPLLYRVLLCPFVCTIAVDSKKNVKKKQKSVDAKPRRNKTPTQGIYDFFFVFLYKMLCSFSKFVVINMCNYVYHSQSLIIYNGMC